MISVKSSISKPNLIFFQYEYDKNLPEFLLLHKLEHAACLGLSFNVTVISQDCDYEEVCDKYEPDLVVFESGVPNPACRRLEIKNTHKHPNVLKLGFLHADSFCSARAGFFSDMDQWGIDTFFAIATSAPEHLRSVSDRLYIWPNSINPQIYHDYQQWKTIPVLFTGNNGSLYPWRQRLLKIVSKHYPSLICPHPGYSTKKTVKHVATGEAYARMLNAAWMVPACGTVAKEVVRKHFEIPACGSCLITERSAALEAAGFVDMVNCVFADEHDILDKLYVLFSDAAKRDEVIRGGHELVMARHTNHHRDQILQWFKLQKHLKGNERIVQPDPFKPLAIVRTSPNEAVPYFVAGGQHLQLLELGDKKVSEGKYLEAEHLYLKCSGYIQYMPEPKLRIARCKLYQGKPGSAMRWISQPLQFTLVEYGASSPDPLEWAYFVICLLCQGKTSLAAKRLADFSWMDHSELARLRTVMRMLGIYTGSVANAHDVKVIPSIHNLPAQDWEEWFQQLHLMLSACGQGAIAKRMLSAQRLNIAFGENRKISTNKTVDLFPTRNLQQKINGLKLMRVKNKIEQYEATLKYFLRDLLHKTEERYSYFLPYRFSAARFRQLSIAIEDLGSSPLIKTALLIGAQSGADCTEALEAGLSRNTSNAAFYFVRTSERWRYPNQSRSLLNHLYSPSLSDLCAVVGNIRKNLRIEFFDLIVIDGSEVKYQIDADEKLLDELYRAKVVVLDDIGRSPNGDIHNFLMNNSKLHLADCDMALRDGFSVFERKSEDKEFSDRSLALVNGYGRDYVEMFR
jgi:hypothetical protein